MTWKTEVNRRIRLNSEVTTRLMTPDEAIKAGAMALFGEKYGDEVRVVAMGQDEGAIARVELCGGTHVRRTGDIGLFKIVGESAVAAGVRRIEALTAEAAFDHLTGEEALLAETAARRCAPRPAELPGRVAALVEDKKRLRARAGRCAQGAGDRRGSAAMPPPGRWPRRSPGSASRRGASRACRRASSRAWSMR